MLTNKNLYLVFHTIRKIWLAKLKSSFSQNLLLVSSGRSISLFLGVLFTPFLTRIYDPEAYGFFNLYISWTNLGLAFSSLSYTQGIVAQKKFSRAINLAIFCILSSTLFSLVVYLSLSHLKSFNSILVWAIPIGILLGSYNEILTQFNIWFRRFKFTTSLDIFTNLANRLQAVSYGMYFFKNTGLIIADLITKFLFLTATFYKNYFTLKGEIGRVRIKYIFKTLASNKDIPRFYLTSQLVGKGAAYLPNLLIAHSFGQKLLGSYSFTIGMLNIPLQVLGSAISSVFYNKASELKGEKEKLGKILAKLITTILGLLIIPFSLIIIYSDSLFQFAFGPEWHRSGNYAQLLGLYYIPMLLYYSIASLFLVLKKEMKKLLFDSYGLVIALGSFLMSWIYDDFMVFIVLYSIANFILYNYIIFYFFNIFNISFTRKILPYYGVMAVTIILLLFLKQSW